MIYCSTRDKSKKPISASEAILKGLADDGGLFMPMDIKKQDFNFEEMKKLSFKEIAFKILKIFFTDFTDEELRNCIEGAYDEKFDTELIAPVKKASDMYFIELYHGKTIAFKDMALSILPRLMSVAAKKHKISEDILILTATSGDTGKAALEGFKDVSGTKIIVFYPENGVSKFQELQMRTQSGKNTYVSAIKGNFDDAQTAVKEIFSDKEFGKFLKNKGYRLSSANSINIGRLIPQMVYYFNAYISLLRDNEIEPGEKVNITVPTGNFGNILAAYLSKRIGLPVNRLICASNENRVLTDFFKDGIYDKNREFILTSSPSMDILVSSNLERLIYLSCGGDATLTSELMSKLKTSGSYSIRDNMKEFISDFIGGSANASEVLEEISLMMKDYNYLIDPHTAVASSVYRRYREESRDLSKTLIASTASPFKFSETVYEALGQDKDSNDIFNTIDLLSAYTGCKEPRAIEEVRKAPILHSDVCKISEMRDEIKKLLKI